MLVMFNIPKLPSKMSENEKKLQKLKHADVLVSIHEKSYKGELRNSHMMDALDVIVYECPEMVDMQYVFSFDRRTNEPELTMYYVKKLKEFRNEIARLSKLVEDEGKEEE